LDVAIEGAMYAKTRHTGQTCVAANRFFVHESLAGEFIDRLAGAMAALRVGTGLEPDVQCGPVISAAAADRLDRTVKEAVAAGAQLVTGGSRPPRDGFFFEPTVVADVPPGAAILDQELFGPVAPIVTFSEVDEMVERANATETGLAGYVFGPELGRGLAVAE